MLFEQSKVYKVIWILARKQDMQNVIKNPNMILHKGCLLGCSKMVVKIFPYTIKVYQWNIPPNNLYTLLVELINYLVSC